VNKLNDTTLQQEKQAISETMKQKILSKLPSNLDESAKTNKAIIRKRKICNAADLILVLFLYALTDISQRLLAAFAAGMGIADISDQAWQKKRLNALRG
jgi:hypothetical protein